MANDMLDNSMNETELGPLPSDWDIVPLRELCDDGDGSIQCGPFGSQLHASDYKAEGIPVVNPTHLRFNTIDTSDIPYISKEDAERLNRHYLELGDILISRRGDFSRFSFVSSKQVGWLCGTGCMRIRVKSPRLDNLFLSLLVSTQPIQAYLRDTAVGTIMPNLNGKILDSLPVALPPLAEQSAIAQILCDVQRAKEATEKMIAAVRQLKQSLMRHLFTYGPVPVDQADKVPQRETDYGAVPETWKTMPLNECAVVQTGVAKGRKLNGVEAISVPYLRVANVQDGYLDLSEIKNIEIRRSELPRFSLEAGDVVLTEGGDFDKLGRGFIWNGEVPGCVHQNHIFAVRAKRGMMIPEFLAYLTQSAYGKAYFLSVAHKTTNLACINTTKLKALPALLPPMDEQQEIVRSMQEVDGKIAVEVRKRNALATLFRTLLHDLMTGNVRVNKLEFPVTKEGSP